MTTHDKDKIIAAAKEVGMPQGASDDFHTTLWLLWYPEIKRFYAIAFEAGRQAEREECAALCEYLPVGCGFEGRTFADAIRARSTK